MKLPFKITFWRIIGTVFVLCVVYISICITFFVVGYPHEGEYDWTISDNLGYHHSKNDSYIYDLQTKEIIIPDVRKYIAPYDNDSIAIFWWGDKRGYFNINNGEIISQPQYDGAWIFSSGVGAVAKGDSILFVGLDGKPIHNKKFKRIKGEDYLYKGDYCAIKVGDKYGAIDKSGEWVAPPEWDYAEASQYGYVRLWREGIEYDFDSKNDLRKFPKRIELYGDTIYVFITDSCRTYTRNRNLEYR